MEKRNNKYKIHLEEIELVDGSETGKTIEFEFTNHDNIMALIERAKENNRFENEADNLEFIVGLKLFSEVMMRNRRNPLFEDFAPAFKSFMMKLKGK